ncbi:MAG: hypothetical protein F4148_19215 [Caldilineaceae bacterium SB0675_bin_29]|uniref:Tetratricopeptide repeat protein n=1 Tax=Caldilineaceae bacterium SB0675_bin_29 TaxID=2605266 RepID=A0A6B1G2Q8_9CHLR|nr:hypothetical protein [Caldilineaceae bacterium SB0675_bin_29]
MRVKLILKSTLVFVAAMAIAAAAVLTATTVVSAQAPTGQQGSSSEDGSVVDTATEVEIQRRFNELRREILDDRADSIGWWLSGIALLLAVLVLFVGLAAYFAFRRLRDIEEAVRRSVEQARVHAEEAARLAEEIRGYGGEADEALRSIDGTELALARSQIGEEFSRVPGRAGATAIAEARQLEGEGRLDESIERWKHIASVAEGSNDELAALAFRSIGDLSERLSRSNR